MSKTLGRHFFLSILALCSFSETTQASFMYQGNNPWWIPDPYIGAEAQMLHMPYNNVYGGNILKKNSLQGNVFLGFNFCDAVSIEAGYEATPTKESQPFLSGGQQIFGNLLPAPASGLTNLQYARTQVKGWHTDLLGFYTLHETCRLKLYGSIGIGRPRIFILSYPQSSSIGPANVYASNQTRHFKKTTSVLRLGIGLQHMLTNYVGARINIGWSNTNRFGKMQSKTGGNVFAEPKVSWRYGVGFFSYF